MLFCSSNVAAKDVCVIFYYRDFKHKTKQLFLSILSEEEIMNNKAFITKMHPLLFFSFNSYNLQFTNEELTFLMIGQEDKS